MKLIFEQTKNRQQCGTEIIVNGLNLHCGFSSSTMVTIPIGLQFINGTLSFNLGKSAATIPICKNHEIQLSAAFRDIYGDQS